MDSNALREFLQKKYENPTAFLENVIYPVFGEENYDSSGSYHWLRKHQEDQLAAENAGILDILVLGSLYVDGSQLDIFDVTVASKHQLANNRVGIQQLIRRIISTHSGAFIIFHYKTSDRWDWRFTFCHKGASMEDSTDAKRYTFLLGPGQSCRTAAINFEKIHQTISSTGSFTMKDVIKAFDVEALSDEFFGKYKAQYEKFVSYMADSKNGMRDSFIDTDFDHEGLTDEEICSREEKPLRDYVKKLLGRIVFLYFIQKKGWLGVEPNKDWGEGDMDFMLHLFEKASNRQKDNFLDEVLEPLFEGGLNTDRSSNGHLFNTGIKAMPNGGVLKVPYLNGGLFERDAADEPESVFPAEYFGSLLEFLSQYNFTIDENDPNDAQVGIDPEMLGRIFENLLEDNKDKGTYYTPKEIVQYMCRESLIAYLQKGKNEDEKTLIRNFVISHDTTPLSSRLKIELDQQLIDVKVCDPAIGSGAFPMGILKEIFYCRGALENFDDTARIKKEIINNNLYGVDIEKGAVDIARLRFWLAIVVDEASPEALPNLDYKVMQGDSLIESYNRVDLSHLLDDVGASDNMDGGLFGDEDIIEDTREELRGYLNAYFNCPDHDEKLVIKEDIQTAIRIQLSARNIDLDFADIDIASNQEFFLWHTWFSDVFNHPSGARNGFDIVIGNPPYIKEYENRHAFSKIKGKPYYKAKMDIWFYFLCTGMDLLSENGDLCFIAQPQWRTSDGASVMRDKICAEGRIERLVDFGSYMVFDASTQAMILLLEKSNDNASYPFLFKFNEGEINSKQELEAFLSMPFKNLSFIREQYEGQNFTFPDTPVEASILSKIYSNSNFKIDGLREMTQGIIGGPDDAFKLSTDEAEDYNTTEKKLVKPFTTTTSSYYTPIGEESIIYIHDDNTPSFSQSSHPHIWSKFRPFSDSLHNRREVLNNRKKWYSLWWERDESFFNVGERIAFASRTYGRGFTYTDSDFYASRNCFFIKTERINLKYLVGLLNSDSMLYFMHKKLKKNGDLLQLDKVQFLFIPLVKPEKSVCVRIASVVDKIIDKKKKNPSANTTEEEDVINNIIYSLYGFDETEIETIRLFAENYQ